MALISSSWSLNKLAQVAERCGSTTLRTFLNGAFLQIAQFCPMRTYENTAKMYATLREMQKIFDDPSDNVALAFEMRTADDLSLKNTDVDCTPSHPIAGPSTSTSLPQSRTQTGPVDTSAHHTSPHRGTTQSQEFHVTKKSHWRRSFESARKSYLGLFGEKEKWKGKAVLV